MIPFVFLLLVLLLEAADAVVEYFISPALPWYRHMAVPLFLPPPWGFRAAWAAVYAFLAVSLLSLISHRKRPERKEILVWFSSLVVLNAVWLWVFHEMHSFTGSFILLSALIVLASAAILRLYRIRHFAALLLIPFLLWLAFLLYLHTAILILNR